MSARAKAWVLAPQGLQPLAVADHEVIEYLSAVEARLVPVTPAHARAVIFWRDRIVPLMDFAALGRQASTVTGETVVLGYQLEAGTPLSYVAVALREAPTRLVVDDATACPLPESNTALWNHLAKACFSREGIATPVINIAKLCCAEFRDFLSGYVLQPWLPENTGIGGSAMALDGVDRDRDDVVITSQDKGAAWKVGFDQAKALDNVARDGILEPAEDAGDDWDGDFDEDDDNDWVDDSDLDDDDDWIDDLDEKDGDVSDEDADDDLGDDAEIDWGDDDADDDLGDDAEIDWDDDDADDDWGADDMLDDVTHLDDDEDVFELDDGDNDLDEDDHDWEALEDQDDAANPVASRPRKQMQA